MHVEKSVEDQAERLSRRRCQLHILSLTYIWECHNISYWLWGGQQVFGTDGRSYEQVAPIQTLRALLLSAFLAAPHSKCYRAHIEEYNENITLGAGDCCALSKGRQMDGSGNMLQHPRPATTLAKVTDTQVSMPNELMLPALTQLIPVDTCLPALFAFYTRMWLPAHSFVSPPPFSSLSSTARDSLHQQFAFILSSYSCVTGPGS